LKNFKFEF
jgi:hypothetical protein